MDEKAKKAAIAKVYKLKAEHEQVARLLEGQKRRVAKLDHELAVTNAAVAEEERIRTGAAASGGGGHNAWKRTLGKANGTIAILETRLLRANERRNRAEDHNLGLRHVIDEERRHRMNLDATCERFKNEMRHLDGNIQHGMMEASRLAEENAYLATRMAELVDKNAFEGIRCLETCDELIEYVASEAKASEDFFEKQRLETVEFGPDAKDVMLATVHEAQTKLQKEHMDAHAVNEQLTKYTDAFDRLRDAVGIDDLNDLDPAIQNFIKVEEEYFKLMNYISAVKIDCELEEQGSEIIDRHIEGVKESAKAELARQAAVEAQFAQRDKARADVAALKDASAERVVECRDWAGALNNVFKRLHVDTEQFGVVNGRVTENNDLVFLFGVVEEKVHAEVAKHEARSPQSPVGVRSGGGGGGDGDDETSSVVTSLPPGMDDALERTMARMPGVSSIPSPVLADPSASPPGSGALRPLSSLELKSTFSFAEEDDARVDPPMTAGSGYSASFEEAA